MAAKITIHEMSPEELNNLIQKTVKNEFEHMSNEFQKAFGEDDLISIGTACRLLGMSKKYFNILVDRGQFTVYHHMKERRFKRGEILEYRNKHKTNKKRGWGGNLQLLH